MTDPTPAEALKAGAWHELPNAPEGIPIIAQYHEWNDRSRPLAEQVVWFYDEAWRPYPRTDAEAYIERWRPMPTPDAGEVRTYREGVEEPTPDDIERVALALEVAWDEADELPPIAFTPGEREYLARAAYVAAIRKLP